MTLLDVKETHLVAQPAVVIRTKVPHGQLESVMEQATLFPLLPDQWR